MLVVSVAVWILERYQIRLRCVLPAILELLGHASAALRESCIANLVAIHQYLSASLTYCLFHMCVVGACYALISLAMVVGTHIEDGVILTVVPTNKLVVALGEREEVVASALMLAALLNLCQQPRARNDSMGFQEFHTRCRTHLARYHACQVFLNRQLVDSHNLIGFYHNAQCAFKSLCLLALPVEVHTYRHIVKRERCILRLWCEGKISVLCASPQYSTLAEFYHLVACNHLALSHIRLVQTE